MKGIIQYKSHTNTISLISSLHRHHLQRLQCRRLSIRNIDSNPIMLKGESTTSKRAVGVICCFMYLDGLTAISRKILLIWLLVLLSLTPIFIFMWLVKIPHPYYVYFNCSMNERDGIVIWYYDISAQNYTICWQKWDERTEGKKRQVSQLLLRKKKE